MELFSRFKQDYLNYLLSIILPAIVMGVSIPVLKQMLGAKGYGNYSIYFNAILIGSSILSGWICQSIIRFYAIDKNKESFAHHAIKITFATQLIVSLPFLVIISWVTHDLILGALIELALFSICLQFSFLALAQSGFLSKKMIFSETLRVVAYFGTAILFLSFLNISYLYLLFISVIIGYLLSALYLYRKIKEKLKYDQTEESGFDYAYWVKKFYKYGAPLSLWMVFSSLFSYIDKVYILKNFGAEVQGNYQAIFDLLSRTLVILISPIGISMFPLLTLSYKNGEIAEIKKTLIKIISFELAALVLVSLLYWLFGANIVFAILKVPNTLTYKIMGLIVIAATFVWQISMLAHKRFELRQKSILLLGIVIVSFLAQFLFYMIFQHSSTPIIYPLGFLISTSLYLILVSLSEVKFIFNTLVKPLKSMYKEKAIEGV